MDINILIHNNLSLINNIIYKKFSYTINCINKNILIHEGMFAIAYAATKFNKTKHNKFSTYAYMWIIHFIQQYLLKCHTNMEFFFKNSRSLIINKNKTLLLEINYDIDLIEDNEYSIEEQLDNNLMYQQINNILTHKEREIFLMYSNGTSFNKIGKQLNISKEMIRRQYHKIIYLLKKNIPMTNHNKHIKKKHISCQR